MDRYKVIRNTLRLRDLSHIIFKYDYFLEGKIENSFKLYREYYLLTVLNDNLIACATWQSSVIDIWNINTGSNIRSLYGHKRNLEATSETISVLELLPDRSLISGSNDSTVRIWNWHTGECEVILRGNDSVEKIILLSSGKLAVGYPNGIKIWNLDTLKVEFQIQMEEDEINHHSFLEINNYIISSTYLEGDCTLWNLETGYIKSYRSLFENFYQLKVIDKDSFVGISREDKLNIWRIENDELKIDKSFDIPGLINFFVVFNKIIYSIKSNKHYGVKLLELKNESIIDITISKTYLLDVKTLPDNTVAALFTDKLNIYDLEGNNLILEYKVSQISQLTIIGNKLLGIETDLRVFK